MNRTERQAYIAKLEEMQTTITNIEKWLGTYGYQRDFTNASPSVTEIKQQLKNLKLEKLGLESHIATDLPITIEGYVGEDEEQVDQDEHGVVNEVYHYLGCPVFPKEHNRHYGTVQYDKFRDLTEIFKMNTGKYIRVSVEEVPLGDGESCGKCENRFKCLTTKVCK
ncbi:MAG: hypothetical protein PHW33_02300 [Candidatus Portnoybacteria bacterium]|jgi:hypothetical protein|nr:hypothetical protein [Candidatus Portnoybacteria bacterium]